MQCFSLFLLFNIYFRVHWVSTALLLQSWAMNCCFGPSFIHSWSPCSMKLFPTPDVKQCIWIKTLFLNNLIKINILKNPKPSQLNTKPLPGPQSSCQPEGEGCSRLSFPQCPQSVPEASLSARGCLKCCWISHQCPANTKQGWVLPGVIYLGHVNIGVLSKSEGKWRGGNKKARRN